MPKMTSKKYGNDLDNLLERIEAPGALAPKKRWDAYNKIIAVKQTETLFKLMEYYGIDHQDERRFLELSIKLAEHHVPAMSFSQKSHKAIWDWEAHLKLYCLIEWGQSEGKSYKEIMPLLSVSSLKEVVSPDISDKTIANELSKFKKSSRGKLLLELISAIPDEDKPKYYHAIAFGS